MPKKKQVAKKATGEEFLAVLDPDIAAYVRRVHRYLNGPRRKGKYGTTIEYLLYRYAGIQLTHAGNPTPTPSEQWRAMCQVATSRKPFPPLPSVDIVTNMCAWNVAGGRWPAVSETSALRAECK